MSRPTNASIIMRRSSTRCSVTKSRSKHASLWPSNSLKSLGKQSHSKRWLTIKSQNPRRGKSRMYRPTKVKSRKTTRLTISTLSIKTHHRRERTAGKCRTLQVVDSRPNPVKTKRIRTISKSLSESKTTISRSSRSLSGLFQRSHR